jgi:nicotinamide riboside kinase
MVSTLPPRIKIGIVGPESCGKTTLAKDLADALCYTVIPEYSRLYFNQKQTTDYDISDIIHIAQGQLALEMRHPFNAIVCDTHLLVCKIWAEVKFGYCPAWITAHYIPTTYTLHLLTAPDVPWEDDPLRENPYDRDTLFALYQADLQQSQAAYIVLSGNRQRRLDHALDALAQLNLSSQVY